MRLRPHRAAQVRDGGDWRRVAAHVCGNFQDPFPPPRAAHLRSSRIHAHRAERRPWRAEAWEHRCAPMRPLSQGQPCDGGREGGM